MSAQHLKPITPLSAALAILCAALWGANAPAAQMTQDHLPPLGTAGLRFLISVPFLALWFIGSFDAAVDPVMSFSADNSFGLKPGSQVAIRVADYLNADWIDGGTATVSTDGLLIESDAGSGLHTLSTLALVVP